MNNKEVVRILVDNDLKVTPQRVAILSVMTDMDDHPSVEELAVQLHEANPHISMGTIYNTLEIFSKKGIISKVLSKGNETRYETKKENHHHLYCADSDRLEDYYDDEITEILNDYFSKKEIPGFRITDMKLHISGKFTNTRGSIEKDKLKTK
jgi:Fur family transcriptional regulator, peroxide stress response regulator